MAMYAHPDPTFEFEDEVLIAMTSKRVRRMVLDMSRRTEEIMLGPEIANDAALHERKKVVTCARKGYDGMVAIFARRRKTKHICLSVLKQHIWGENTTPDSWKEYASLYSWAVKGAAFSGRTEAVNRFMRLRLDDPNELPMLHLFDYRKNPIARDIAWAVKGYATLGMTDDALNLLRRLPPMRLDNFDPACGMIYARALIAGKDETAARLDRAFVEHNLVNDNEMLFDEKVIYTIAKRGRIDLLVRKFRASWLHRDRGTNRSFKVVLVIHSLLGFVSAGRLDLMDRFSAEVCALLPDEDLTFAMLCAVSKAVISGRRKFSLQVAHAKILLRHYFLRCDGVSAQAFVRKVDEMVSGQKHSVYYCEFPRSSADFLQWLNRTIKTEIAEGTPDWPLRVATACFLDDTYS